MLLEYAKGNDKLEVKAGVLAGRLMLQEDMKKVVTLPSKEVAAGSTAWDYGIAALEVAGCHECCA